MNGQPTTLLQTSLNEQEQRHAAAIAAIRARASDIAEAQKLVEAMSSRGGKVRATVDTFPNGAQSTCRIALWLTTTRAQFSEIKTWLLEADITLTRLPPLDIGEISMYELMLRTQTLQLRVALQDPKRESFRFSRATTPEAV